MKSLLKIIPFTLLFLNCGGSKIEKLLKTGNVVQKDFSVTIPFEYRQGLMIIKAEIGGNTYDFILDTGASNVLSKDLNVKLGLQPIDAALVYGSQGASQQLEYTSVKTITIGGIGFTNTIAAIHDFNAVTELACMNIKGIIGANLMRQAVWDIDFKNQNITITNTEESLEIPSEYKEAKFFIGYQGTPSIITNVNGIRVLNNRIDTGYNGNISFSKLEFQKLTKDKKLTNYVTGTGITGVGIYGAGKTETFYKGLIEKMTLGKLTLDSPIVASFSGRNRKLIGVEFLKNYRVIFNWNTRRIKFIETTPSSNSSFDTFGYGLSFEENKIYIRSIIEKSSADRSGLQIGDQVLGLNDIDCSTISAEQWCEKSKNDWITPSEKSITMTINRDNKVTKINLEKLEVLKQ
ncbi:aspartyl protease family protein [Aquimarina pacifica]|uniref:aspartyl protease family protein n=1 Tax=Aquimarina pacifica TaxID=1296415 RepID=UPI0004719F0C|nr:aspartyl protease family protein [Aquimarina pacifica]